MLATITSSTTGPDGTGYVMIRAARPGSVTVTWGTQGMTAFTLQLDVAAYQVQ
ncbi:hypothetical protein [Streptomyces violascens]|uniref:hypothetical protein n=1 Tax=Streptomyces violascens TaxID=67381 RepID=UPI00366632B9